MKPRRHLRWLTPAALGVLAVGVIYGRFLMQARQGVRDAQAAVSRGDKVEAVRAYLDALRAYVPGSPFERQALDGLGALAAEASASQDWEGERRAWEAVRRGLLGTRSLYVPHPWRLREANLRLAQLGATVPFPPDPRLVLRRGYGLADAPASATSVLVSTLLSLLGFALWVGTIVLLIRRGLGDKPTGSVRNAPPRSVVPAFARGWTDRFLLPAIFAVGFALFLLGLRLA